MPQQAQVLDPETGQLISVEEAKALIASRQAVGGRNSAPGSPRPSPAPGGGGPPMPPRLLTPPSGPQEPAPGEEPLDIQGALAQLAGFIQMLPMGKAAGLAANMAPAAVEAIGQLISGEGEPMEILNQLALGTALPQGVRGALKAPQKLAEGMGTYTRSLTRGGANVRAGMPTVSGAMTTGAKPPIQLPQLNRIAQMVQDQRLAFNPESFGKLVEQSTALENEIVRRLPRQVVYQPGMDLAALARKHGVDRKLIDAFEDVETLFTLMKQSERQAAITGSQASKFSSGLSVGGGGAAVASLLGASNPVGWGLAMGAPTALLNMSPNMALRTANAMTTLGETGAPIAEGLTRAGTTAAVAGSPQRRRVKDRDR
jgi:hypothetical protein